MRRNMRVIVAILLVLPFARAMGQEQKDKKAATRVQPPSKKAPAAQRPVPAGAQEIEPDKTYRYRDADVKTWIYRGTPFGFMKVPEELEEQARKAPAGEITAVEEGDSVRFARWTLFGKIEWVRKKTGLDAAERAAWEQAREKQPAKTAGSKVDK